MSVVYRAVDMTVGRTVALKVLRISGHAPEESIERFRIEMRAIGRLNHDCVVPIYDVGEECGHHYLVMRHFPEGSLAACLRAAPLPDRRAAALMARVARAVESLHGLGVIHRDLKPSNILLDGDGHPHVGDFGLAKILGEDPELTRDAAVLGTPSYMPPEQATDPAHAREAADVYSLGATLYCALTGRPPFQSADPIETLRQVRDLDPQPPRRLNPSISLDLEVICLKCLEKDPRLRFDGARELAEELERFARGEPIRTRPPSIPGRIARLASRRPLAAALLGLVVVLATATFAAVTLSWLQAEQGRRRLERDAYFDHVALAAEALTGNRVDRAERWLKDCPVPLRGWEWRVLWRLCHESPTTLPGPDTPLRTLAFRPDSSGLVGIGRRGYARAWDLATGRSLETLPGLPEDVGVRDMAWMAPKGNADCIAVGFEDGSVRIWVQGERGWSLRPLGGRHQQAVHRLAAHAQSGRLLSVGDDGRILSWDVATGRSAVLAALGRPLWDVAISPDGESYSVTGEGRRVWLGRFGAGAPPVLGEINGTGMALAFSPDGRTLASGEASGSIILWDVDRSAENRELEGHLDGITGLAFSPDGLRLASGGDDALVKLWDTTDGREVLSLKAAGPVEAVDFSPDGRYLAATTDGGPATVWDASPAPEPRLPHPEVLSGHEGTIVTLAVSARGERIASGGNDGTVRLWDAARGESTVLATGARHPSKINAVSFRDDGHFLAAGGRDHLIWIWDARSGELAGHLEGHRDWVGALAYGPDGRSLASADQTGRVLLWDLETQGVAPRELGRCPDGVYALAFHPGGDLVAAAGEDRVIWLLDRRGSPPAPLEGHASSVVDLSFSPDGRLLASAGSDRAVIVWDLGSRKMRYRLEAHAGRVWGVAFSPDNQTLATAGADRAVRLWDVETGRKRLELRGHEGHVCAVAFSPDGRFLASAGGDRTVRLWPAADWAVAAPEASR
jgi:WD40 repeat protein